MRAELTQSVTHARYRVPATGQQALRFPKEPAELRSGWRGAAVQVAERSGDDGLSRGLRSLCGRGWPGLGQQQPNQSQPAAGNRGEAEERDAAAEMVACITSERGAQRRPNPDRAAHDAEPESEAPGAAGDIRDHKRQNHT